ncbi:MAG: flagellar hook-basal body protein [Proteobacteria bacterium]|nr:flagellar hook-basal body protein [Pseudomonadota bacterium]
MIKGIFSTLSGKFLTERRMDIISNNIANASTPGYKMMRPVFNVEKSDSNSVTNNQQQDTYTNFADSYIHFSNAPLVESGNKLDIGIEGDGFFVISTKDGPMYARNGQFAINKEKKLVTLDGSSVLGQSGEIRVEGADVRIEGDGSIFVDKTFVDKLKIVDFKDKKDLRNYGNSMFINMNQDNIETTPETYTIKQGFYETSNVDVIKEMIELMSTLRAYESYTKVDQFFSDMMSKIINVGR